MIFTRAKKNNNNRGIPLFLKLWVTLTQALLSTGYKSQL